MKDFFRQNRMIVGLVIVLGSELLVALLLWAGLAVAGETTQSHLRWFAIIFVAPVLLLRHYAKRRNQALVTKTIATALFVTFILFMVYLIKTGTLTM